jgi:hypothetical protein
MKSERFQIYCPLGGNTLLSFPLGSIGKKYWPIRQCYRIVKAFCKAPEGLKKVAHISRSLFAVFLLDMQLRFSYILATKGKFL